MYRLLLDTNILLDALVPERPGSGSAWQVIERCNGGGDFGMASSLSLKDIYYILRRQHGEHVARNMTREVMGVVVTAPVNAEECDEAMRSGEPDFEDGIIRACAELNGADYIITRDARAFHGSTVPALTAAEYLEIAHRRERAELETFQGGVWPR